MHVASEEDRHGYWEVRSKYERRLSDALFLGSKKLRNFLSHSQG